MINNYSPRLLLLVLFVAVSFTGCELPEMKQDVRDQQAELAEERANQLQFSENIEQDNIERRLHETGRPGQTGYILLMNQMGQPIMYAAVDGKPTSSGKRLTRPWRIEGSGSGGYMNVDAPSDEGTWGSSTPYVYFWTTQGQYFQWSGEYLFSYTPFRTTERPLVIFDPTAAPRPQTPPTTP